MSDTAAVPPPPTPPPAALQPPALPPVTPGRYLQLRREAAGLTRSDLALLLLSAERHARPAAFRAPIRLQERHAAERVLADIEEEGRPAALQLVCQIRDHVALDEAVFLALLGRAADPEAPCPPVCLQCGCSFADPCTTAAGPCAWADEDQTLCTACRDFLAASLDAASPLPAGAGHEGAHADAR